MKTNRKPKMKNGKAFASPTPIVEVSDEQKKKLYKNPMIEGVRWIERYADTLEKAWSKVPKYFANVLVTLSIFVIGSALKGDWILIFVHIMKHLNLSDTKNDSAVHLQGNFDEINPPTELQMFLEKLYLKDIGHFWISAVVGSYAIYFAIGGFIHWYFYVRQRDNPHAWKCQPEKFLTPEIELHEIMVGSLSLFISSSLTGFLACYTVNGGPLVTIYYRMNECGWLWFFLQIPAIFLYQDYSTYWIHRLYHTPWLYKNFHKLHHTYKQPTAFSVTAIHPVEILNVNFTLLLPIFTVPVHWGTFYGVALYTYYHGLIDHSGVTFKAHWWQPWQPDAIFHDNHHQYFHVNFGFNIQYWDKLHGTYRRKDRVYTEEIFYGKGKTFEDVDQDVLQKDLAERKTENPLAYRENVRVYEVGDLDTLKMKQR